MLRDYLETHHGPDRLASASSIRVYESRAARHAAYRLPRRLRRRRAGRRASSLPLDAMPLRQAGRQHGDRATFSGASPSESAIGNFGVYFGNETSRQSPPGSEEGLSAMKFSLFVHMERLDAEQNQQRASTRSSSSSARSPTGRHARDLDRRASRHGLHHRAEPVHQPSPIWRAGPRTVRLGTGTVIAPFWHPIKLAGEAAMTDVICDGRLDIGIARGAYSFEYRAPVARARRLGRRPAHARDDPGHQEACGKATMRMRASSGRSRRRPRRRSRCSSRTRRSGSRRAIRTATNSRSPTAAMSR